MRRTFRFLVLVVVMILLFSVPVAADYTDIIKDYNVVAEPQADGTLTLNYVLNWCYVKDAGSDLTWIQLGLPNKNFEVLEFTSSVPEAKLEESKGSWSGVKFVLPASRGVKVGGCWQIGLKVRQMRMAHKKENQVSYQYIPGWFDDYPIEHLKITWKLPEDQTLVLQLDPSPQTKDGNEAIWEASLKPGQKFTVNLLYKAEAFPQLSETVPEPPRPEKDLCGIPFLVIVIIVLAVAFIIIMIMILGSDGGGSYSSGSTFGGYSSGGGGGGGGGRSSGGGGSFGGRGSSCACVSSCACACACAGGGGHAGCVLKGFVVTNLQIALQLAMSAERGRR